MADHDTLRHAWRRYGAFDAAAVDHQRRFLRMRRVILIAGVLVAAAGIASAAVGEAAKAPGSTWEAIQRPIEWVTRVASLALAGLFTFAARFDRGEPWVLSRRTAELVQREILLYRTRRGPYKVAEGVVGKLDVILAAQLRTLTRDAPQQFGPARAGEFQPRVVRTASGEPMRLAGGAPDDGLCQLAADDYIQMRIAEQQAWYARKAKRARSSLRVHQTAGIIVGLFGPLITIAGSPLIAWVAIPTSVAAAITSWAELRRLEPTASAYERAAAELDDLLLWWHTLPPAERASEDSFDKLVSEAELVMESENASWMQEMRKRIAELRAEAERRAAAGKPKE